jgi:hypothetical protein
MRHPRFRSKLDLDCSRNARKPFDTVIVARTLDRFPDTTTERVCCFGTVVVAQSSCKCNSSTLHTLAMLADVLVSHCPSPLKPHLGPSLSPIPLSLLRALTPTRSLPFLRLICTHLLHLLHAHIVVLMLRDLLALAGQLGLPLAFAGLGFANAILLVRVDLL